jgi:hypothetical protein
MDNNIEEYLTIKSLDKQLSDDRYINCYYERDISKYRSSTLKIDTSWGDTLIEKGEEKYYEEFS